MNPTLPVRTHLRLLTRVHFHDAKGQSRDCLASIVELGPRSARIESARALDTGARIELRVVFPGQRQYGSGHVSLHYLVRKAHDETELCYDLDAVDLDAETRERLALFLERRPHGGR